MFPVFIDSFGEQFDAVLINSFGSVLVAFMNAITVAFVNAVISPLLKSFAAMIGLPA